jgi:CRP-like cAMP-binding protein
MPIKDKRGNQILKRLPAADLRRIMPRMQVVAPKLGEVVAHPGAEPKFVHFPISGVLSSMVVLEDGQTVEASTVGNEGMDGLYLLADPLANPYRINVQVEGEMLRMPTKAFRQELAASNAFSQLLLRYGLVLIQRGAQNGACIQHHSIEERMCRWLLETAYRKGEDQFGLTQEFLADMLGVRRQSVNLTARVLQAANLIKYHRGELTILDRPGLEEASCECFQVTTKMYERMMQLARRHLLQRRIAFWRSGVSIPTKVSMSPNLSPTASSKSNLSASIRSNTMVAKCRFVRKIGKKMVNSQRFSNKA